MSIGAGGLTVAGDEELLRRAAGNPVTNVLVHTPSDTVASLGASAAGPVGARLHRTVK